MQRRTLKRTRSTSLTRDPSTWKKLKFNPRPTTSLAAKVNKLIASQEKKWFDVSSPVTGFTNASPGIITPLNSIPEGVDESQRIGRKIHLESSALTFAWIYPTPVTGEFLYATRTMIVYDNQTNNATVSVTDVLETDNALSHLNLNNVKRFTVIYDNFNMRSKGDNTDFQALAGFNGTKCYDKAFRALDHDTVYAGAATAEPNSGGLFLINIAAGNLPVGTGLICHINHRLRYTDA